jgi:hypothetical protein
MTGDIVAEVDGVDVLNRGDGEKPWPFERVSPLIKGAPGSVVTIAFLRPSAPPQDEDDPDIPEGQTFQVKIRRQDRRGPASDMGMSPRGSQQAQHPPALPGGSSSGAGAAWHAAIESDRGGRPPTPPYGGRLADDDSDMGRADGSIEARLRAHARGAVNAAAMARKLMTSSGICITHTYTRGICITHTHMHTHTLLWPGSSWRPQVLLYIHMYDTHTHTHVCVCVCVFLSLLSPNPLSHSSLSLLSRSLHINPKP